MHIFHRWKFVKGEPIDLRCYLFYECKCGAENVEQTSLSTMMRIIRHNEELKMIDKLRAKVNKGDING